MVYTAWKFVPRKPDGEATDSVRSEILHEEVGKLIGRSWVSFYRPMELQMHNKCVVRFLGRGGQTKTKIFREIGEKIEIHVERELQGVTYRRIIILDFYAPGLKDVEILTERLNRAFSCPAHKSWQVLH